MGFSVDPDAVAALSKQMERLQEHATAGKSYVGSHTEISFTGEGLINLIAGGHREVQGQVEHFLSRLAEPTAATMSEALIDAARYYRSTDHASAEQLDGTYPGSDVAAARRDVDEVSAQAGAFEDVTDPTSHYTAPKDYHDELAYEPSWWDIASPSAMIRNAILKVTELGAMVGACDRGYDIYELILKPVCGDWAGMRACADVFRNVARAAEDMSENIRWSTQGMTDVWTGNAADGCQVHLLELARALDSAAEPLDAIAGEYQAAADGARDFRDALGPVISDAGDAALKAAASAGITVAAGSTKVGLPVALIVGAFTVSKIYRVIDLLRTALDLADRIESAARAFDSAGNSFGQVDADNPLPRLPDGAPRVPSPET
ncbi:hypothetical protein [Haloechinothrix sp. LS1_15]|uniref:hypothetical protein n=1 Tax=Haloechinothrix sp. LS1_15 TaxID=2652248 RepID=UPI002947B3A0|nr:hypothetical protein [Haloechinothrix sp. LS1_15]MDV6012325.1 hypothetical protein [Haloechinothrix sp. LS1_15]